MKHLSAEPFKSWFGYTRRERRSSFILLILIVAFAGVRFIIPKRNTKVEMIPLGKWENSGDTLHIKKSKTIYQTKGKSIVYAKDKKLLDINTCDSASLEALPGIGPVLSIRIIKFRNLLGGYASVDQLREVYGLSEETFNLISGRVTADSSCIKKIKINQADYKQLVRFPYFEKYEVSAILKYVELKGKINSMSDLVDNKLITPEKAVKVKPYLEFGK
jgi:DNA uptake protein ComE-like DNA-binding protein